MSLAFNVQGEPFDLPPHAMAWRVRKVKPKGAPEVVYGRDGLPLVLDVGADVEDLKREVADPGRYRLDALDEAQRAIADVPPAYAYLHNEPKAAAPAIAGHDPMLLEALRLTSEAMRANMELARTVIDQFPKMMESAAVLLRAADGAGLPARAPRALPDDDAEDDPDEEDDHDDRDERHTAARPAPPSPGPDLATMIAQLLPTALAAFTHRASPTPSAPALVAGPTPAEHYAAVVAALPREHRRIAQALAEELSPADREAWFESLAALSVSEAAARVHALLVRGTAERADERDRAAEAQDGDVYPEMPGSEGQSATVPEDPAAIPDAAAHQPQAAPVHSSPGSAAPRRRNAAAAPRQTLGGMRWSSTAPPLKFIPFARDEAPLLDRLAPVLGALEPPERRLALALVDELAPAPRRALLQALAAEPPTNAVAMLRAVLADEGGSEDQAHAAPTTNAPEIGPLRAMLDRAQLFPVWLKLTPLERRLTRALLEAMATDERRRWLRHVTAAPAHEALAEVRAVLSAIPPAARLALSEPPPRAGLAAWARPSLEAQPPPRALAPSAKDTMRPPPRLPPLIVIPATP